MILESTAPHIERKRFTNIFPLAEDSRSYDERPVILEHIDPQLYLSRNEIAQPFFLVCEKDTVLAAMSGDADVEFRECSVLHHRLSTGDFVYVPAGTPHRIVPRSPALHVRYKAREAGLEAVAWYCTACGTERRRIEFDTSVVLPQEAYARACEQYAATVSGTACVKCGELAPHLELGNIRWKAIAEAVRSIPAAPSPS